MDSTGRPVPGACVVLNRWHVHSDRVGFFHWSIEAPLPEQVEIKIFKRYDADWSDPNSKAEYETLETTVDLSELESQPITLKNR